jgi:hypothetical protein
MFHAKYKTIGKVEGSKATGNDLLRVTLSRKCVHGRHGNGYKRRATLYLGV